MKSFILKIFEESNEVCKYSVHRSQLLQSAAQSVYICREMHKMEQNEVQS